MAEIDSLFRQATAVHETDLDGTWFAVRHVSTSKFMTGASGKDIVWVIDSMTTSRPADAPTMKAWSLTFKRDSAGLRLTENVGGGPRTYDSKVDSVGDFRFTPDLSADVTVVYHCRAVAPVHLVCIDKEHVGDGIELRKQP